MEFEAPAESDKSLLKLYSAAMKRYQSLKSEPGYKFARYLRSKVTNHYLIDKITKNLGFVTEKVDSVILLHDTRGNSFYPVAEDLVFNPALTKLGKENDKSPSEVLNQWMDWSIRAASIVSEVMEIISSMLFQDRLDKTGKEILLEIEDELISDATIRPLPIFHFVDRSDSKV